MVCTFLFAQDASEVLIDTAYVADENLDLRYVDPKDVYTTRAYMDEDVGSKKFDDKKWKEVVGDLTYEEDVVKDKKPKEKKNKSGGWSFPAGSAELLKMVSFVAVFILFAFILYYVSKNTTLSQSIKKMKPSDVHAPVENIEELDIDGLLRQALTDGDLRVAVRIRYLMLLKKLNEAGLIAWKKNKTNRDYLSELYGRNSCYDDVRELTLAYEIVWYGEHSVSSDSFQRLTGEFESVNRHITRVQPTA